MPRKVGFFSALIIPLLVVIGFYGGGIMIFLAPVFVFILIPLADAAVGLDTSNHAESEKSIISEEYVYRLITFVWVIIQFSFLIWTVIVLAKWQNGNFIEYAAFILGTGMVTGGIGITVAHELGHKNNRFEQFLSQLLLMTVSYMHFFIEHNRGHHVQVATPEDPATARRDEGFYQFFIRSVIMGWSHAWELEKQRLSKKNKSILSIGNKMIWYSALPIIFCIGLTYLSLWINPELKWWVVPTFFILQSIIAFGLLELVNYVEHYGITRIKLPDGTYERVNPLHSWNTAYLISNLFLFQLQRHSDHHTYAAKRYQVLDHFDESPQLPYGYPTMILLALVPPLWFSVMNKRLEHWKQNLYPIH